MNRVGRALCVGVASAAGVGSGAEPLLFDGVRVFDGFRALGTRDVLIDGGVIVAVGDELAADGAAVIDGTGLTLMPGMIDAHTHTWAANQLETAADLGVTTGMDMFTAAPMLSMLRGQLASDTELCDLKSSGTLLTARNGHGTQFGFAIDTVNSLDEVEPFVAARFEEENADYLKIACEDGSAFGGEMNAITPEVLGASVAAAHAREKMAVVHVTTIEWARRAVDAGADGLVHLFVDAEADDAFVADAAESGLVVTPTLSIISRVANSEDWAEVLNDERLSRHLDPGMQAGLAATFGTRAKRPEMLERALASVGKLHKAGVVILAGTDAPNPGTAHGASMHQELKLLSRAGLSNEEALSAATGMVARSYGFDDRGVIEAGRRADLLLVRGDPVQDLDATRDIEGVWIRGNRIDRAPLAPAPEGGVAPADGSMISGFDDGTMASSLGAGWAVSLDAMMGGSSKAALNVIAEGADQTPGALRVSGEVTDKAQSPWAGVQLSPGAGPFQPADLSAAGGVSFKARGDGRTYALVVFSQGRGFEPSVSLFTPGRDRWSDHAITWKELGIDGSDVTLIVFSAGLPAGTFAFDLDEVRLIEDAG